jgi:hypothetical protein
LFQYGFSNPPVGLTDFVGGQCEDVCSRKATGRLPFLQAAKKNKSASPAEGMTVADFAILGGGSAVDVLPRLKFMGFHGTSDLGRRREMQCWGGYFLMINKVFFGVAGAFFLAALLGDLCTLLSPFGGRISRLF